MKNKFTLFLIMSGISGICLCNPDNLSGGELLNLKSVNLSSTATNALAADVSVVTITPDTIDKEGVVTVSISINNPDDLQYGEFHLYAPENKASYYYYFQSLEVLNGVYHKIIDIDEFDLSGNWHIGNLNLNYSGGMVSYDDEALNARFDVINTTPDTIPPVVRNLNLSKSTAHAKDTVVISMQIFDSLSGTRNFSVYVTDTLNNEVFSSALYVGGEQVKNAEWNYIIKKFEYPGPRIITFVGDDMKGNYLSLNEDTVTFSLIITGTTADTIVPNVLNAKISGNGNSDEAFLDISATDENSGIAQIDGTITSSNFYTYLSSDNFIRLNDSTYRYELFNENPYFPSGNYNIDLSVRDSAVNYFYYQQEGLTINNINSDYENPVIISAVFDKDTCYPGDNVTLTLHLSDDKSGIQYISYTLLNKLSSKNEISGSVELTEANLTDYTYSKTIKLSDFGPLGTWSLESLYIYDNAGRGNLLTDEYPEFYYFPKYRDDIPPVFEEISFEPSEVVAGDTVTIILKASDDYSGIKDINLSLNNSLGFIDFARSQWYQAGENRLELKLPVNKYMKEGIVNCYLGTISDLADNQLYIGIDARAYKVINESDFDILPPVFDSLSLSRELVMEGDTQNFVFYLHDNLSGIDPKSLLAIFGSIESPDEEIIVVFPERTGINTYSASLKGEKMRPGIYFLSGLVISDSANNEFQFDEDFGKGYGFIVAEDHEPDTKAPEIISYHIYPELVQPGDTVHIEVKTKDEGYGVMGVYAFLANSFGTDAAQFEWNDWTNVAANDTLLFKTNYIVPELAGNGTWVIYQTYVLDFAVNSSILEYGSDYTNATFEVRGGQSLPNRPPRWIMNDINLTVEAGSPLEYKIPDYLVADIDRDEITFSTSMQNGSAALPWITFTPENLQVILNPGSEHKGSYTLLVKAADTDGLHEELRVNILVEGPDGTDSHVSDNFSVYPNPATDILNFEGLSNIKHISFYSIHGELILTTSGSSGQVDVSNLERGVYILRIESEKMTVIRKITLIHSF